MHWYSCISYYSDASISYKGARNSSYIPIHMLQQLSWPKLQTRRKISRLQIFHKILHNDIPISIPSNYLPMARETRQFHQHHFILPLLSTIQPTKEVSFQKQYKNGTPYHNLLLI